VGAQECGARGAGGYWGAGVAGHGLGAGGEEGKVEWIVPTWLQEAALSLCGEDLDRGIFRLVLLWLRAQSCSGVLQIPARAGDRDARPGLPFSDCLQLALALLERSRRCCAGHGRYGRGC
jgi:hypothetical protein